MKNFSLIPLMLLTTVIFAQNFTISHRQTDSIFIGLDNPLRLLGYNRGDDVSVIFPTSVNGRKLGPFNYNLTAVRPSNYQQLIVLKNNAPVDTITLSIFRVTFKEFIATKNKGLIKSGTFPLALIRNIDKIGQVYPLLKSS